jgi:hypothetical protein
LRGWKRASFGWSQTAVQSDDDYAVSVLRHRCGDEIADQVVSVETLKLALELVAARSPAG